MSHLLNLTDIHISCLPKQQVQNATPATEASPAKRRGRPPKSAAATPAAEKDKAGATMVSGAGRGRKRAADPNSAESIDIKVSKQQQQNDEGTKRQIELRYEILALF